MSEQCVKVSVSLIEALVGAHGFSTLPPHVYDGFRALLSQPTPTGEADEWIDGYGFPPPHLRHHHLLTRTVAPPRIDDMVPGTTFTGTTRQGFTQRFERVSRGRVRAENGTLWSPVDYRGRDRIDPSTIRDVTPPELSA